MRRWFWREISAELSETGWLGMGWEGRAETIGGHWACWRFICWLLIALFYGGLWVINLLEPIGSSSLGQSVAFLSWSWRLEVLRSCFWVIFCLCSLTDWPSTIFWLFGSYGCWRFFSFCRFFCSRFDFRGLGYLFLSLIQNNDFLRFINHLDGWMGTCVLPLVE